VLALGRRPGYLRRVVAAGSSECLSEEILGAWVVGRLRGAELAAVEAHVAGCPSCLHRVGEAAGKDRSASAERLGSFQRSEAEARAAWAEVEAWAGEERAGHAAAREPGPAPAVVPGARVGAGSPAVSELLEGRYELTELIAQGGMGEVYRGVDRQTGARVAIKRLKTEAQGPADGELLARFTREAETLRRLDHPNIVKMLAIVQHGDQHSIVMEYVGCGSLRRELLRQNALPQMEALLLTLEVAEALAQAHRSRVIHRDIKPENVLLADDGSVRLSDFGLARMGDRGFTAPGAVLGTVAYLSPEILWGHEVDERTDLWSLGVMLFEMLSGVRPFVASSPGATLTAILQQPVPSLWDVCPEAPPGLVQLVARLLEKDRERRIGSASEVSREIEAILERLVADE
jgi:tRNA A-37 threonylcarbamoyl transferase component Bud32